MKAAKPIRPTGVLAGIRFSLRKKLMFVVLTTTFLALLLMGSTMLIYELRTYRESWINDMVAVSSSMVKTPLVAPSVRISRSTSSIASGRNEGPSSEPCCESPAAEMRGFPSSWCQMNSAAPSAPAVGWRFST